MSKFIIKEYRFGYNKNVVLQRIQQKDDQSKKTAYENLKAATRNFKGTIKVCETNTIYVAWAVTIVPWARLLQNSKIKQTDRTLDKPDCY